jgi:hypothetical protein
MKTSLWVGVLILAAAGTLCADDPEVVRVPLGDPARPAHVQVHLMNGPIMVRGADVKEITVEARGGTPLRDNRRPDPKAQGMKRLDAGAGSGINVDEQNNSVTIKSGLLMGNADLTITVPRRCSLQLKTMQGRIAAQNVVGEIDVNTMTGDIDLKNVSGSVLAHSLNGPITVTMDRVDSVKAMSFSTLNGDIDVTLPATTRANVKMKTDNGEIYSDFDVKLASNTSVVTNDSLREDGRYRIRLDRTLHGTINGGGPDIQFTSFNGKIYIRRKK